MYNDTPANAAVAYFYCQVDRFEKDVGGYGGSVSAHSVSLPD